MFQTIQCNLCVILFLICIPLFLGLLPYKPGRGCVGSPWGASAIVGLMTKKFQFVVTYYRSRPPNHPINIQYTEVMKG